MTLVTDHRGHVRTSRPRLIGAALLIPAPALFCAPGQTALFAPSSLYKPALEPTWSHSSGVPCSSNMMPQKRSSPSSAARVLSDSSPEKSPRRSWRGSADRPQEQPAPPSGHSSRRRRSQAPSRTRRSRDASPPGDSSVWDASTWTRPSPAHSARGRSPRASSARGRQRNRDRSPLRSVTRTVTVNDKGKAPSPHHSLGRWVRVPI